MKRLMRLVLRLARATRAAGGEKAGWRALVLCASVLIVAPSGTDAQPSSRLPDRITGYGGYQFGMRLEDAKEIDARAKVTNCDYRDTAFCLERADNFFGEPGEIRILFSANDRRLSRIHLSFDRFAGTGGACKTGSETVAEALLRRFGPPTKVQGGKLFWYAAAGGAVSFLALCVDDDAGMIVVSYEPSSGF
ncbi:MAG TPA: hypothetical protein VFN71_15960 [Methylomirabilota bacterium]|nr:hypothetical protein [Methylomirabilota bacterium]